MAEVSERLKNVRMSGKRTHQQMEDLRIAQVSGETKMVKANRASKIQDEHFRKEFSGYEIPEYESDNYHVVMEARLFNHQTGAKLSRPKVQIFDPATFDRLIKTNGFYGHTTYIIHDPSVSGSAPKKSEEVKQLVDEKTGKIKTTEAGQADMTSVPFGGQGNESIQTTSGHAPGQNPLEKDKSGFLGQEKNSPNPNTADGPPADDETEEDGQLGLNDDEAEEDVEFEKPGTDPMTVDPNTLSDADAKRVYMDLTGKSPDGRWSTEKLKEKIAEIQGDIK